MDKEGFGLISTHFTDDGGLTSERKAGKSGVEGGISRPPLARRGRFVDRRSPRRRPNRRESEATADGKREQVINSEGTEGAELRASEPEIRFPISFDVERCRMEEGGKEVYID